MKESVQQSIANYLGNSNDYLLWFRISNVSEQESIMQRLEKLADMKLKGILTDEEFLILKSQMMKKASEEGIWSSYLFQYNLSYKGAFCFHHQISGNVFAVLFYAYLDNQTSCW